jgi:HSP20 family protein
MVEKTSQTGFWPSLYDPFRLAGSRLADWLAPAAEASQSNGGYNIKMELPGVDEKDLTITVDGGVVEVKGEKKTEHEEKGESWYFSERQFGAFSRSFRLPPDADEAKVAAKMKDGVLTVTLPRKPEAAPPPGKTIQITKG